MPDMCCQAPLPRSSRRGFTLVELLIAIAIAALLAGLAWPSLRDAVYKSRRADAMAALAQIAQAQERWRANNPQYRDTLGADANGVTLAPTVSHDGHYELSLVDGSVNASAYTARATARSSSPQASDSRCQVLQMAVSGGNISYSSYAAGGSANGTPDPCWVR